MKENPTEVVFVIDDDESMRAAIARLLAAVGLSTQTFSSGMEFLEAHQPNVAGCVVLDVRLPQISGLDLQREMVERGIHYPVIFVTGHGDIQMSVQAMKAGAVEFLTKPFRDQDLLDAISAAIQRDRAARTKRADTAELRKCYDDLTPREKEVVSMVISGLLNKQIAVELGASEKTIKIHRGRAMQKMRADSLADLVRMAERLHIEPYQS